MPLNLKQDIAKQIPMKEKFELCRLRKEIISKLFLKRS
jgi:hypothetical protein